MRTIALCLAAAGLLVAFALACMGCGVPPAPLPDAAEVDGRRVGTAGQVRAVPREFDRLLDPGSDCDPTELCAFDGSTTTVCAAMTNPPQPSVFSIGCCVPATVCPNAAPGRGVCAYEVGVRLNDPKGPAQTWGVDCGDGRGLRLGL